MIYGFSLLTRQNSISGCCYVREWLPTIQPRLAGLFLRNRAVKSVGSLATAMLMASANPSEISSRGSVFRNAESSSTFVADKTRPSRSFCWVG